MCRNDIFTKALKNYHTAPKKFPSMLTVSEWFTFHILTILLSIIYHQVPNNQFPTLLSYQLPVFTFYCSGLLLYKILCSYKILFSLLKRYFSGNKTLDQHPGANKKKHLFAKFWNTFLAFSSFFSFFDTKNIEKVYFDQHLECTAPKHWSKYTTHRYFGALFSALGPRHDFWHS